MKKTFLLLTFINLVLFSDFSYAIGKEDCGGRPADSVPSEEASVFSDSYGEHGGIYIRGEAAKKAFEAMKISGLKVKFYSDAGNDRRFSAIYNFIQGDRLKCLEWLKASPDVEAGFRFGNRLKNSTGLAVTKYTCEVETR